MSGSVLYPTGETWNSHFNSSRSICIWTDLPMTDPDPLSRALQLLAARQPDRGEELLLRCLELAPQHSHACVALGDRPPEARRPAAGQRARRYGPTPATLWPRRTWARSSARRRAACGRFTACAAPSRPTPKTRRPCTAWPAPRAASSRLRSTYR
ncbi:MAG: hypothetical protein LUQ59_12530 [Methanothrix sp.]|nr:hypothetical protein [Methanothrix sp.]